ncbi:uncharacterized protein CIMG_07662 [Coccidioides immitis RS]|uniref:Uncharacterized protein n=3 Tax=Coccidioides immitis TaxID=5501 RepID=A0A0E1RWD3_COCIM|nr:uncharacterized protein CIMG_07662 [Coccidioides immitis RS]EAS28916.2 hypothetical protein CIMG_07662 [Coccidioides immitis RS]KMP06040.1 hypothetical protein CIRG_05721 [Coccidioides immitis RMSCC 2394]KMU87717.1 hypothetical protein CIHG_05484 [Coccidioides immitis H538.4]
MANIRKPPRILIQNSSPLNFRLPLIGFASVGHSHGGLQPFRIEDAKDIVIIQRTFTPISYQRFPFFQTRVPQCLVVNRCSASVCFSPRPSD